MFCGVVVKYNGHRVCALCPECASRLDGCGRSIGRFTCAQAVCVSAFEYRDDVRDRLLEMKRPEHKEYAQCFAGYMAPAVRAAYRGVPFDAVCCVPGYEPEERLYNQARVLARRLSEELGLPLRADLLVQIREKKRQHSLSAADRFKNVRQAYAVLADRAEDVRSKTLLLVDDIVTTGATMASCRDKLLEAGAAGVYCAAAARTVGMSRPDTGLRGDNKENSVEQFAEM